MPEINLPTAGKQDTILANTNAINSNVTSVNTNVNANKSTLATVNANLGTPTSGASNATGSNAHAKLNYILNKTSKNLLASTPVMGKSQGWILNTFFDRPSVVFGNTLFSVTGPCAIFNLKISMYTINQYNASLKVTIDGKSFYYDAMYVREGVTAVELPFISCINGISVTTSKGELNTDRDPWGVSYSHYHLL